ncbi:hypothetical protein [Corallococcus aberystwythensis]|uniref:Uncharacterized protein n=1 Tax=Corallococcus aberystwythensis TaxID=2316722 RepID=A0A3A8PR10_9BACT|nr:hypothetical protein [Corallococcus aberystwythensis]RKH56125.1 hypothetical protein D7W81_34740 [Corallococcus aberystwythensis]
MTNRHREEPVIRPFRLVETRLAVPGVIGMRNAWSLSFGKMPHVLIGPDAGFPEFQPLDDWKNEVALVDARALPREVREEAGLKDPAEERAMFADSELADLIDEGHLENLRILERARLTPLDERARGVLTAHGHAYWLAGYSRHSSTLWVHLIGGAAPRQAWAGYWSTPPPQPPAEGPPAWLSPEVYLELRLARWADRVLRALSDGMVTETGLLFARVREATFHLAEDDLAQAGMEAAALMAAGADEVVLPLHGPARRVRLPPFIRNVHERSPFERAEPSHMREIHVPAEDAWMLTKDLR